MFETAQSALDKSCYLKIDWKCSEDDFVIDVVKRMVRGPPQKKGRGKRLGFCGWNPSTIIRTARL